MRPLSVRASIDQGGLVWPDQLSVVGYWADFPLRIEMYSLGVGGFFGIMDGLARVRATWGDKGHCSLKPST